MRNLPFLSCFAAAAKLLVFIGNQETLRFPLTPSLSPIGGEGIKKDLINDPLNKSPFKGRAEVIKLLAASYSFSFRRSRSRAVWADKILIASREPWKR
jgi:hypothetical protein